MKAYVDSHSPSRGKVNKGAGKDTIENDDEAIRSSDIFSGRYQRLAKFPMMKVCLNWCIVYINLEHTRGYEGLKFWIQKMRPVVLIILAPASSKTDVTTPGCEVF